MDKIIKPNDYEKLSEIEKLRRRDVRKELYKLISKMSNNNAVVRDELYIKLYKNYKKIKGINLQKEAENSATKKVVEYAEHYGYIDDLLNFAKDLYKKNMEVGK